MNIVVNILFAGLIVFVPNDYAHPSWITAYLLDAPGHVRSLTLYGTVNPNQTFQPSSSFKCMKTPVGAGKLFKVSCELPKETEISINGAMMASGNSLLPTSPGKEVPMSLDEAKEKDWFLHISNIDTSNIRGINLSKAEAAAGAKISLPWDDAEACELDGEELHKYKDIGFRSKSGNLSGFQQAVAESMLLHFNVSPGRLRVILSNQEEVETINIDCYGPNCLSVGIDNSMPDCNPAEDPGVHFSKYYEVINHSLGSEIMLPYRVDGEGECPKKEKDRALSLSLLGCDVKLLAPISPRFAELGREFIEDRVRRGKTSDVKVTEFTNNLARNGLVRRDINIFTSVFARQVMNRVICPPVVVSP